MLESGQSGFERGSPILGHERRFKLRLLSTLTDGPGCVGTGRDPSRHAQPKRGRPAPDA